MKQHSSWNGIIAGLMAFCVTLLSPGCVTKSDSSENQTDSVCTVANTPQVEKTIIQDSVNNHPKGHDEAWRKENGFLLGQIYDKDGYTNIRAGQSTKTDILGTLSDGEKILYKNVPGSNWFDVYDLDGARLGYVHSSRIVSVRSSALPQEEVFTTPDLKWARVQGRVKTLVMNYMNIYGVTITETLHFDKNGKLIQIQMNGCRDAIIRKNTTGQIVGIKYDYGDENEYEYDKDGHVIVWRNSECDWAFRGDYKVNDKGWILKTKAEDECLHDYKSVYSYLKIDGHGNWLKATEKYTMKDPGECIEGGRSTGKINYTRKITYWE